MVYLSTPLYVHCPKIPISVQQQNRFSLSTFRYTRNDFLGHLYIFLLTFDRIPFIFYFVAITTKPLHDCLLGSNVLVHKICVNNCLLFNIRHQISDTTLLLLPLLSDVHLFPCGRTMRESGVGVGAI